MTTIEMPRITPLLAHVLLLSAPIFPASHVAALPEGNTDLGGGVVTRTNVEVFADLSLDVRDIREVLDAPGDGTAGAESIYMDGRNAERQLGLRTSLKSLSDDLASLNAPSRTPNYLYHLYGLAERSKNLPDLAAEANYADNFVQQALSGGQGLGPNAIVALNMWMYGTHLLLDGVDKCNRLSVADDPDAIDLNGGGFDEFIALWIGKDQVPASTDGHGLYALAQEAASYFGNQEDDEAPANSQLKLLYEEAAGTLSIDSVCSQNNKESVQILWSVAQRMVSQMFIPLVQMLIRSILQRDAAAVDLYAMAVIPQTAQCRPSVFKRLREELLAGSVNFDRDQQILRDLREILPCLGISCEELGTYLDPSAINDQCLSSDAIIPMAEYQPRTQVQKLAMIDLDILQMRILTSLQTYSFASYLYSYGKNSPKPRDSEFDLYEVHSLQQYATSAARRGAGIFYTEFVDYNNDPIYAHNLVMGTLKGGRKWGSAPNAQRSEVIVATCAYQIMFLYLVAEFNDAVKDCRYQDPNDNEGDVNAWDEAAALLIGSLEGTTAGGSSDLEDGQLLWNLANQRAFQFQTLNEMGYSKTNSQLENLLFAGRGELDALDCKNLEITVDKITHILLVPLIQSTLRYALQSEGVDSTAGTVALALGEIFAFSVLPVVNIYDEESALFIRENMEVQGVSAVPDGTQRVADAFGSVVPSFGIRCSELGGTPGAEPCLLSRQTSGSQQLRPAMVFACATGLISLLYLL